MPGGGAKRWCFTINNWNDSELHQLEESVETNAESDKESMEPQKGRLVQYLIVQSELGASGTRHLQGFLVLRERHTLLWLKKYISPRAHWEVARGTDAQCKAYCSKEDTFDGEVREELGSLPEKTPLKKREERLQEAIEELDILKEGYKRPSEIPSCTLMQCGFVQAMHEICADILGPYRPQLKIITLVGPPGTGKSYAIQKVFPEHGRCIYGNSGCWFQNPTANVMIFEEFNGQIPLQRMLQLLDPYPLALEVKGRMAPAMYTIVVITSNTSPASWYPIKPQDEMEQGDIFKRKMDSIHALWDRLGYSNGAYVPVRKCGTYLEAPSLAGSIGMSAEDYIFGCRQMFYRELLKVTDTAEDISDDDVPYTTDDDHDDDDGH